MSQHYTVPYHRRTDSDVTNARYSVAEVGISTDISCSAYESIKFEFMPSYRCCRVSEGAVGFIVFVIYAISVSWVNVSDRIVMY